MILKKLCFVTREYAHPKMGGTGGIGVFLKHHTKQLYKNGLKITIFSFGKRAVRFDDNGVSIVKIKDLSAFNDWFKSILRRFKIPGYIRIKMLLEYMNRLYISIYLSLFVKKHGFDIIEFHDYGGDAAFFISSLPMVIRCHGSALSLHKFMGYYHRKTDSVFEKRLFKRFGSYTIAVSNYSATITQEAFGLKQKPKVIYNSVDVPNPKANQGYLDNPTEPFSIFYFGSIRERKGIDVACHVFNSILVDYPEASFHVMGNNNNNYWNTVAFNLLSDAAKERTTYYGSIPNTEVTNYLGRGHVFLFPSYGENFSIGLLEVMALGKITITSNIPAFNEIIQHGINGFVADSLLDYCNRISDVFDRRADVEFVSEQAFNTVKNNFNAQFITQQNIDYYQSVITSKITP